MTILEYDKDLEPIDYQEVEIGKLYFFKNFVVAEFYEGVHIDFNNFSECRLLMLSFYKQQPFGFIANQTNTYSLHLNDAKRFNLSFPNLKAYAVVCNTLFGHGIFEIENQFFNFNRKIFKNLDNAISWVETILNKKS